MARSDRNHAHDVKQDFVPEGEEVEPDPAERTEFADFVPAPEEDADDRPEDAKGRKLNKDGSVSKRQPADDEE